MGPKMKQQNKCLTGDPIRVARYTSSWLSVRIHPASYYRRLDDFLESLNKTKGMYAILDTGPYVLIKFAEKDDLTAFHRQHHQYV